jgi:o-succinylbenzoate synthase
LLPKSVLSVYRFEQPLEVPYRLSFGTLDFFDTLIVAVRDGGQLGLGEITPLPGYSEETIDSARAALNRVGDAARGGLPLSEQVRSLASSDPMVASALACAAETLEEGIEAAFQTAVPDPLPLAALCGGDRPAAAEAGARALQERGYTHLKLKAGGGAIEDDIARLRAIAGALEAGATISVDANQRLAEAEARALCAVAADLPVQLVEQPFPPDAWDAFARLAAEVPVPLMLDESIWTSGDVDRAAEVGAKWVKLKLCKHPGMVANRRLIERARALGLKVVYGNGVQGAVGNHLEARIYADAALDTPGEFNGVLKIASDPFGRCFSVERGKLSVYGLLDLGVAFAGVEPMLEFAFTP